MAAAVGEARRARILAGLPVGAGLGVEIGPLTTPIVPPGTPGLLYADRVSTEDLRAQYADHAAQGLVALDAIVPIDLVLGPGGLAGALGDRGPVAYVVASHVLEHVPDPIGWLADVAGCLVEDGRIALALPDKRFTFDHFRACAGARDLIDWYVGGRTMPAPGLVYDHLARAAVVDLKAVWRGEPVAFQAVPGHSPAFGLARAREAEARGDYCDVHCLVATPWSFAEILRELLGLGLLPLAVEAYRPTERDAGEFTLTLRKDTGATAEARAATVPALDPAECHALPGRPAAS